MGGLHKGQSTISISKEDVLFLLWWKRHVSNLKTVPRGASRWFCVTHNSLVFGKFVTPHLCLLL